MEAYEEKKGMAIRMSKMQLAHKMKIYGGFLPALALEVGALLGLASTWIQKLIGNGLYLKKVSGVCRI